VKGKVMKGLVFHGAGKKKNMPSHCQTVGAIGWIFGHLIDGTQAEYVRVPYAETSSPSRT
jgi:threonine dehydrogenase-like Zn-dependent dehydrogenase